ncbi:hypothetical protein ACFL45_08915 [Candidatus Neomarinimicrobiota bacterium]
MKSKELQRAKDTIYEVCDIPDTTVPLESRASHLWYNNQTRASQNSLYANATYEYPFSSGTRLIELVYPEIMI